MKTLSLVQANLDRLLEEFPADGNIVSAAIRDRVQRVADDTEATRVYYGVKQAYMEAGEMLSVIHSMFDEEAMSDFYPDVERCVVEQVGAIQ